MHLRDYQKQIFDDCKKSVIDKEDTIIVLPTGGGKTVIFTELAKYFCKEGYSFLFITHRKMIKEQIKTYFENEIFLLDKQVFIEMIVSLSHRESKKEYFYKMDKLIIVFDECHHLISKSWQRLFDYFHDRVKLGFTATPFFGKMNRFSFFKKEIQPISYKSLIDQGYLATPNFIKIKDIYSEEFLEELNQELGEYQLKSGDYVFNEDKITFWSKEELLSQIIDACRKRNLIDSKTIVFCIRIDHAENVYTYFKKCGINSRIIHSKLSKAEINEILKEYRDNKITYLISVAMLDEGFDVPDSKVAIMLRPTASHRFYLQSIGRVLRKKEGDNEAIIFDAVSNYNRFGSPYNFQTIIEKDALFWKESIVLSCQIRYLFIMQSFINLIGLFDQHTYTNLKDFCDLFNRLKTAKYRNLMFNNDQFYVNVKEYTDMDVVTYNYNLYNIFHIQEPRLHFYQILEELQDIHFDKHSFLEKKHHSYLTNLKNFDKFQQFIVKLEKEFLVKYTEGLEKKEREGRIKIQTEEGHIKLENLLKKYLKTQKQSYNVRDCIKDFLKNHKNLFIDNSLFLEIIEKYLKKSQGDPDDIRKKTYSCLQYKFNIDYINNRANYQTYKECLKLLNYEKYDKIVHYWGQDIHAAKI